MFHIRKLEGGWVKREKSKNNELQGKFKMESDN